MVQKELPVDSGWSWVICLACFIITSMLGVALQALSVLFLELVLEFGSSVTVTSLVIMVYIMSLSVSSLVSTSILVPRFGERRVIFVSGMVFSSCSIGYSLAPNIWVFIAIASVQGTSVGTVFVPSISLLSRYFKKRRSLATTIGNSGLCVASIVAPPIIRAITGQFGMRGTFLILAAVELHMSAAGLLMRPVAFYRAVPMDTTQETLLNGKENSKVGDTDKPTSEQTNDDDKTADTDKSEDQTTRTPPERPAQTQATPAHRRYFKRMNSVVSDVYPDASEMSEFIERRASVSSSKTRHGEWSGRGRSLRRASLGQGSVKSQNDGNWSWSQKKTGDTTHHGSILSVASTVEAAAVALGVQEDGQTEEDQNVCWLVWFFKRVFDPALLRQWTFRVYLIFAVPSAATQYLMQYIPTISVVQGATKDQAATIQTIVGAVDLTSRLAMGVLADTNLLRPTQICATCQICLGIICQFNPLFRSFESMIAMAVFMGLFIGTRQSMMPLMHIEIVGIEKMSRCLSITAMIVTISAACHSPALSAVMEATGSFVVVLCYVGIAVIIGGIAMLFTPCLARLDARLEQQKRNAPEVLQS